MVTAAERWASATLAQADHPYLVAHGIGPEGLRQDGDMLLVAAKDIETREVVGILGISPDGRAHTEGRVAGAMASIGASASKRIIRVCTGWADGVRVHEETGDPVAVALEEDNLRTIAEAMQHRYPSSTIIAANEISEWNGAHNGDGPSGPEARGWPGRPDVPGALIPEPLPVDVLPSVLRNHVRSVAASAQVSPDMTVLLGLCCISATVAGKVQVRVDDAWTREWVTLYGALVAPPAERKSTAYGAMTEPLREWEVDAAAKAAPGHRMAIEKADVAERRLHHVKDQRARGKGSDDKVESEVLAHEAALRAIPVVPMLLAQDSTPEALVVQMAEQGGRVAVMSPEGGPLRILDGRYSDGAARLEELAQAYDGEELRPRRIGRDTRQVRRPALTLAVALQPSVLATIRNGRSLRGQGIYGRISWVVPPSLVGRRVDSAEAPPLDARAAKRYATVLHRLLEWQPAAVAEDGTLTPHVLTLSREAAAAKRAYHYAVEAAMREGGDLAGIRDWAGKAVGRAVRVAVLLELAARAADGLSGLTEPISAWAMEGAVRLCEALSTHALRVYADIGRDEQTRMLRHVLDRALSLPEGSTLRDLHRAVDRTEGLATMDDLAPIVEELEERGCLRLHEVRRPGPGRQPSPVIEVHPALAVRARVDGDRIDRMAITPGRRPDSVGSVPLNAGTVVPQEQSGGHTPEVPYLWSTIPGHVEEVAADE